MQAGGGEALQQLRLRGGEHPPAPLQPVHVGEQPQALRARRQLLRRQVRHPPVHQAQYGLRPGGLPDEQPRSFRMQNAV